MRRPILAVVVFLCLHVVPSAQVPISTKREQETQKQKAGLPPESAERAVFNVGKFPIGITFDGANIWVTNSEGESVTKLRANDGAVLGNFKVGKAPGGAVFDGMNIWVTNEESNNVMKLRVRDDAVLDTFKVWDSPAPGPL